MQSPLKFNNEIYKVIYRDRFHLIVFIDSGLLISEANFLHLTENRRVGKGTKVDFGKNVTCYVMVSYSSTYGIHKIRY